MSKTGPRSHVSVTTKDVIVDFNDGDCRTLVITLAVKCRCSPTICFSMPTPHKLTSGGTPEDWDQIGHQLIIVFVVKAAKNISPVNEAIFLGEVRQNL